MRSYEAYAAIVEEALLPQLSALGAMPDILRDAMAYSLSAGGKRLRPVLLLAACEAGGGSIDEALPYAVALEMIHTYSLIHDDLPAMDNDDLRRGKPTNHKVFGEAMAILAGDGLLSAACELLMKSALACPDRRGIAAAEAIMRRAGVTGMVGGQVMDVTGEGTEVTVDKVRYIHAHKTADLLTAPLEAGMLLAGASADRLQAAIEYGQHLGICFQIVDDLLDVQGDTATLGKHTGKDAQAGKLTWVAAVGLDQAKKDAAAHAHLAAEAARCFEGRDGFFTRLCERLLPRVS